MFRGYRHLRRRGRPRKLGYKYLRHFKVLNLTDKIIQAWTERKCNIHVNNHD